jgi:hypothetical protein
VSKIINGHRIPIHVRTLNVPRLVTSPEKGSTSIRLELCFEIILETLCSSKIMYRHSTRPILSAAKPRACRHASTKTHSPLRRGLGTVGLLGGSLAFVAYYYDSRSIIHEHVAMPIIRATMDAEQSHRMAIRLLGAGAWARPKDKGVDDERLSAMVSPLPVDRS